MPDAIVLVGGRGTRLRSVVADRPKPLAEVAGRPFLYWLLRKLAGHGIRRVVLSAGYRAEQVEAFACGARDELEGLELIVVHEPTALGTGGAVRFALPHVRSPEVFVLNGDSFCAADLDAMLRHFDEKQADAVLLLTQVNDTSRFGSIDLGDRGEIEGFREKTGASGAGSINAGVYLIRTELVSGIPPDRAVSLEREVFPLWLGRALYGFESPGPFIDIGTPESYAAASTSLDWATLTEAPSR